MYHVKYRFHTKDKHVSQQANISVYFGKVNHPGYLWRMFGRGEMKYWETKEETFVIEQKGNNGWSELG